jgi:hypothetical protein
MISAEKNVEEALTQRTTMLEERLRIYTRGHLHNGLFSTAIRKLANEQL